MNWTMIAIKSILIVATLAAIAGCGNTPESGSGGHSAPSSASRIEQLGSRCREMPEKTGLLCESGELALFSGETAEDVASNKAREPESSAPCRNSLFLRIRKADGTEEWRVLLTTGSDWREAAGMDEWCSGMAKELKNRFSVSKASFSSDGRHLWLVCSPHTYTYNVVCSYDFCNRTFRVLIDGDTADEQPDGTILAKNRKTYLIDGSGEPLGARFYDAWTNPDGEVVRKGKLKTGEEVDQTPPGIAGQVPHTSKSVPWIVDAAIAVRNKSVAAHFEQHSKSGAGRAFADRHLFPAGPVGRGQ